MNNSGITNVFGMCLRAIHRTVISPVVLIALLAACTSDSTLELNSGQIDTSTTTTGFAVNGMASSHASSPSSGPRQIIKNPTRAEILEHGPLPEVSFGNPNAPVTVVKYASLTCPICRKFQRVVFPEFKKTYIDTGKVHFILRQFPIGRSAGNAAIALRCAPMDKHLALYNKFLDQQHKWVSQEVRLDAIFAIAKQVGMTRAKFDDCLKNQGMIEGLRWVKDRGRTLGIIGTPNFYIQNKLIKKALDMDGMRAEIEPILAATTVSSKQSR